MNIDDENPPAPMALTAGEENNAPTVYARSPHDAEEMDMVEAQARYILQEIDLRNNFQNPPAEKNNRARPLVGDLRNALAYDPNDNLEATLRAQAQVLDNAFRRLLSNADTTFENSDRCDFHPAQYALAMKAQEQFCHTARALMLLEKQKKPKKRVLKRDEQTEGPAK